MSPRKLPNYLRTYRRRSGLSQPELAFLVGCHNAQQISRFERCHRLPSYHTILAYKVVFQIPTSELFGGEYQRIERAVRLRARVLAKRLANGSPDAATIRKLEVLTKVIEAPDKRPHP
jgi:transcriptional regulator with XRE-family HTH domain